MATLIHLTRADDFDLWLNPDYIVEVGPWHDIDGETPVVTGSVLRVARTSGIDTVRVKEIPAQINQLFRLSELGGSL